MSTTEARRSIEEPKKKNKETLKGFKSFEGPVPRLCKGNHQVVSSNHQHSALCNIKNGKNTGGMKSNHSCEFYLCTDKRKWFQELL